MAPGAQLTGHGAHLRTRRARPRPTRRIRRSRACARDDRARAPESACGGSRGPLLVACTKCGRAKAPGHDPDSSMRASIRPRSANSAAREAGLGIPGTARRQGRRDRAVRCLGGTQAVVVVAVVRRVAVPVRRARVLGLVPVVATAVHAVCGASDPLPNSSSIVASHCRRNTSVSPCARCVATARSVASQRASSMRPYRHSKRLRRTRRRR